MRAETYRKYGVEYEYQGSRWSLDIFATCWEDAEARVLALREAQVSGPVEMEIPAWPGALWIVRAWCWARNWLNAG